MRLKDRVILTTGAANGIGRAAALSFAARIFTDQVQAERPVWMIAASLAQGPDKRTDIGGAVREGEPSSVHDVDISRGQ